MLPKAGLLDRSPLSKALSLRYIPGCQSEKGGVLKGLPTPPLKPCDGSIDGGRVGVTLWIVWAVLGCTLAVVGGKGGGFEGGRVGWGGGGGRRVRGQMSECPVLLCSVWGSLVKGHGNHMAQRTRLSEGRPGSHCCPV